jgi:integrase
MQDDVSKPVAEVISIEELYEIGNSTENTVAKVLFFLCYLSGSRIGEAIELTRRDIHKSTSENELLIELKTEKRQDHPIRTIPILIIDNPNHKLFNAYEKKMATAIINYIKDMKPDEIAFPISRQRAFNLFTKYFSTNVRFHLKDNTATDIEEKKINPHYLRHCRLTHLRQEYGYDVVSLMRFAGWKDSQMANIYLHIGYKDLTREMLR